MNEPSINDPRDAPSLSEELDRLLKTAESAGFLFNALSDKLKPILLPEESDKSATASVEAFLKVSPLTSKLIQAREVIESYLFKIDRIISRVDV